MEIRYRIAKQGRGHTIRTDVIGPTAKEQERYDQFVRSLTPEMNLISPTVRRSAEILVPSRHQEPCPLCQYAEYNHNCQRTRECLPLLYYIFNRLNAMTDKEAVSCFADNANKPGPTTNRKAASAAETRAASKRTISSGRPKRKSSVKPVRPSSRSRKPSKKR